MDTVIVLGCNTGGLAVIRSLGRRGLKVIAMTHNRTDVGTVSKYVHEVIWCPDPADEDAFVNFLIENAPRWEGSPLIIESGDAFTRVLSYHKTRLSDYYTITSPDWEVASVFLEKRKTYALAARNNVPYPWTIEPTSLEDLEQIKSDIPFPCIIKPISSHAFVKRFKTKVFIVNTYEELKERLAVCIEECHDVMVQEIIPGDDSDFGRVQLLFDTEGNIAAAFHNQKIRQSPPQFGQMRVGGSAEVDKQVEQYAAQLFEGLNYRGGYCSVEFRRDRRDDSLKLMEVNIRAPRSSHLAISAGIDFPWLLYRDYIKGEREHINDYAETIWIEMLPDILNVFVRDRHLLLKPGEFFKPYFSKHRVFAVFTFSDMRPFLKQLGEVTKLFGRELQRMRNLGTVHRKNLTHEQQNA